MASKASECVRWEKGWPLWLCGGWIGKCKVGEGVILMSLVCSWNGMVTVSTTVVAVWKGRESRRVEKDLLWLGCGWSSSDTLSMLKYSGFTGKDMG